MKNAIDISGYVFNEQRRNVMRDELGIPRNAFVTGHVGGFREVKNHTFLIDIFDEIHKQREDAVLLLVGDGNLRNETEQKAKRLGLEKSIVFTGVRSDVSELMQAMDIFVFPSLYEGLPLTLIEAQAAGLLCCAADTVSPESAVTENIRFLSLQNSAKDWSDKVLSYAEGFRRCDTTAEIVQAGYDISSAAKALEEFYLREFSEHEK